MILVVPIAGKDPNFRRAYKPFVDIHNTPLIKHITSQHNLDSMRKIIFISLKEHEEKYDVTERLSSLFGKKIEVILLTKKTDGAPRSILEGARDLIDTDEEIVIELADVMRDVSNLYTDIKKYKNYDGIVPVEKKYIQDRKWGYVHISGNDITHIKEKQLKPRSYLATMGLYFFSRGKDFIRGAESMMKHKQYFINGSYFVGPVYNEMIKMGYKFRISQNKIHAVLGNPIDIAAYGHTRT